MFILYDYYYSVGAAAADAEARVAFTCATHTSFGFINSKPLMELPSTSAPTFRMATTPIIYIGTVAALPTT